jgi:hypothetical protein
MDLRRRLAIVDDGSFTDDSRLPSSSAPMYNVKALPNPCHLNTVMILKGILSGTVRNLAQKLPMSR